MKKYQKGFTLVEILVVIAVLSLIGVLILTIFARSLKGTNKSQIISSIKQNGQSVLESMTNSIRNADNVVCPSLVFPSFDTLVIVSNGTYTRYRFFSEPLDKKTNGYIKRDNPVKQPTPIDPSNPAVCKEITDPGCREETDAELVNRVCATGSLMSDDAVILTDTDPKTGVSLKTGIFTRDSSAGFKDNIKVKFDLDNPVDVFPVLANEIDPVTFETTIELR